MDPQLFAVLLALGQLAGALFVAWVAVRMALSRFKSEKIWERQVIALADVVGAIRDLHRTTLDARDEAGGYIIRKGRFNDHSGSSRRLRDAISVGLVILPEETRKLLVELQEVLDRPMPSDTWLVSHLEKQAEEMDHTTQLLLDQRRTVLGKA